LKSLLHFKELFPETILGLSDHTPGDHTVLGAIALGARVIEKHFTDDTNRVGPDHKFSMSPEMWDKMVQNANLVFAALGDGRKKVELNEEESRIVQRRAIRFTRDLKKGHVLERSDISVLRPAPPQALGPNSINEIIGKSLKESVKQNQLVQLSSLSFLND
jgi:N-acetylneuraminate synthase